MSVARRVRAALILALALVHLLLGGLWVTGASLLSRRLGRHAAALWNRILMALMRVRLHRHGRPQRGALLVANHLSWLDIVALFALVPDTFLSKAELRDWPIVGRVARNLGTLFIGRGHSGAAQRAAGEMAERLRRGDAVIFFPEGRISTEFGIQPFRPRLFRAAHEADSAVQPVAIGYRPRHRGDDLGELVPERRMLDSAWWAAGHGVEVHIHFLDPIPAAERDRRQLADEARKRIADRAGLPLLGRTPANGDD
ncbi:MULTISPECIES: lysophospholipid acyltransferase family protein [unclassified Halorhodospira]|uniref:lysophospholipid acyltransferase family protein n=1 Tax=unclassified Halorhodospira TaxID=2626748 RepID=UPI001EE900EB|nr:MULTISPECIES: lysophospholipid acyltransferase family protein [unclassified Halorhodospira]MCG5542047.1 1-acyl-sn-glycerol-3-phosphate acyltransferase [Halorhodospira sp. M39old]MCG5546838.1 1-acyl-sn-glycerol-3-phosphate acyltransferase [Halorhodospira sp. M38]